MVSTFAPPPECGSGPSPDVLLRRLAAALAHHVNNALTGVVGYLDLALLGATPAAEREQYLRGGLECAHRAAETVRRIVTFAGRVHETGVAVALCLRVLADEAARSLRGRGTPALEVAATGEEQLEVWAHPALLRSALEQVLHNAVEAMPAGGTLVLRVERAEGRGRLVVTDSGPGLPAAMRGRLFEPFVTTKGAGHLGLGLALCRDMMEAQGGGLEVTSPACRGTEVTLSLPTEVAAGATTLLQRSVCSKAS
jgi:signal transduction histidine kinase